MAASAARSALREALDMTEACAQVLEDCEIAFMEIEERLEVVQSAETGQIVD